MENLDKFATKLLEYLNSAEAFVAGQAPEFVGQFIAFEIWRTNWIFWVSLVILILLAIVQALIIFVGNDDERVGVVIVIGALGLGALCWTLENYTALKKLEMAPKVYMVERATKLIKGKE